MTAVDKPSKKKFSPEPTSGVRLRAAAKVKTQPAKSVRPTKPPPAGGSPPKIDLTWKTKFLNSARGDKLACSHNVSLVFSHDPRWKEILQYDEFVGDIISTREPPWHPDYAPARYEKGGWSHKDVVRAGQWLAREYDFACPTHVVVEGLHVVADRYVVHPVRSWLNSLEPKWDGRARCDDFLIRLAGAADTPYSRAVASKFLIGAVARIMEPGCQVDSMPVFEGDQGTGKTSMLRILGGEWFMSTNVEPGSKDSYQVLKAKWIVEFGELDALSRSEITRIKQYITQAVDRYRPSYGHAAADHRRNCVFAGTINPELGGYLKDPTGARRFWPLRLGRIDLKKLAAERDQIWAEAVVRYKRGEKWHFVEASLIQAAAEEAENRRQMDPWEAPVGEWLSQKGPKTREQGVTTYDVLVRCLGLEAGRLTRGDEMRVATILRTVGWDDVRKRRVEGVATRVYRPATQLKLVKSPHRAKSGSTTPMLPLRGGNKGDGGNGSGNA